MFSFDITSMEKSLVLGNMELMLQDPADGSYDLEDYIILSRRNPGSDKTITIPFLGKVAVVRGNPPLAGREVKVRGTLLDYWVEKDSESGRILYTEFAGSDLARVREFRKPFNLSRRIEKETDLARYYHWLLRGMKHQEVIFGAKKNQQFDSIEGIQAPDRKSWVLL